MSLRLYADDTTGYYSDTCPTVLQVVVNSELSLLSSWFDENHRLVSNDKTQALPLGPCSYKYDITLRGIKGGSQESMKILGVTLDKMLTLYGGNSRRHMPNFAALRRFRRFVPAEVLISLYNSFVLPQLEYCSPLFLAVGKVQACRLEDANFYILRSILGYRRTISYQELPGIVNMKTVEHRRLCSSFLLLYKSLFCNGPS